MLTFYECFTILYVQTSPYECFLVNFNTTNNIVVNHLSTYFSNVKLQHFENLSLQRHVTLKFSKVANFVGISNLLLTALRRSFHVHYFYLFFYFDIQNV